MRPADLDLEELLEVDADTGVIRFAGQRALILDAVAMGLLREYLVDNFGRAAARTVLTRFGFAHGWRMAEAMQVEFTWDSEADWRRAGNRIHVLQGLFQVDEDSGDLLSPEGATLSGSYEVEQHLRHFGRSDAVVCWTICGLASGYLSRSSGRDLYVLEDRCIGKGDAACHMVGRAREEWGPAASEDLRYFEPSRLAETLDESLRRVTTTLKAAERKLRARARTLARAAPEVEEPLGLIAKSEPMRRVLDLAHRVAKVDSTVLITGESGAGKERIAQLVHEESSRAAGPFIAVNCGAITDTLLESELFGHARGAFTGAIQDRPGLFEAANRGTLLLDEVGEVSPAMQVKLLRALQEHEVRRVGENKSRNFDVRVLAATNRDLGIGVAGGQFRQDLYYRLNVVELHVPALRDRREDILPLARLLLAKSALQMKRKITGLAPETADQLLSYDWPGNVRELQNAMERAVALARGARVEIEDLPEEIRGAVPRLARRTGPIRPLREVEKEYILEVLQKNEGNQTHTAAQLGIGSATLYRKLKKFGALASQRTSAASRGGGNDPDA